MTDLLLYDQWLDALEEKATRIPKVQGVFSNFEVLPRMGKLLSEKAKECPECKMYWKKLQEATEHLDEFFNDGNSYSADFDELVGEVLRHLKATHAIRPKGLVLSIYTVVGMALGLGVGGAWVLLFHLESFKGGVVLGWLVGVMIGWFAGKFKEERMRKENQIF
ncbi:hypothetical protein [Saccharicrinis fermentans]|uniref:Glycine zipper family protein n=1 Tax=Saccharicrinis fermentans DSM 9555 = JCM 21142 TaxID=869213 RepID=W7YNG4_9BACT|nr:hypothetical protein [Saccharicrinis fermentans]GAF03974.1 hypothetical protein JCM21142_72664 [Saccharicrinis fermentans DSM 9555 = JCM 21142]